MGFATQLSGNFQLIDRKIFPGKSAGVSRKGWLRGDAGFGLYGLISTTGHPVTVSIGKRSYVLSAGQYMLPHYLDDWEVASVPQPHDVRRRIVYFSGSYVSGLWSALGLDPVAEPIRFDEAPRPMEPMLLNLIQMLFRVAARLPLGDKGVEESLLILTYYLLHHHPHSQSGALRTASAAPTVEWRDPRVRRALEYLQHRLSDTVSLDALARAAGWNKYDLGRAIKQATGMTPIQLLQVYRVEKAKTLIASDPAVSEIEMAQAVGYRDPKHFRDVFRRVAGVLPGEYVNTLKAVPSKKSR